MGHFPMGGGAARMHSAVQEHHDATDIEPAEDLNESIFQAPNVQVGHHQNIKD